MKLKMVRHLWGVTTPLAQALPEFKKIGYDLIECGAPADTVGFKSLLSASGLAYIGQAFTGGATPAEHFDAMRKQVDHLVGMGAVKINIHSGADHFSFQQAVDFYGKVAEYEKTVPTPIAHETHRGRVFFNPWITRDVLQAVPGIRLCCDFSHWVVVAERLLGDCESIIELAASRCVHLHARVGYDQGPQVPDPSAPEYAGALRAHLGWWTKIWTHQKNAGMTESTVTPEFGPPGYMHTLPHTNVPVSNLASVCDWTASRVREAFAAV